MNIMKIFESVAGPELELCIYLLSCCFTVTSSSKSGVYLKLFFSSSFTLKISHLTKVLKYFCY